MDVEDPIPPSPPIWVQKSLPEEWPERGIDAHESGGIYLEWEPNTEENIVAYLIFRSRYYPENDSLGEYEILGRNTIESISSFNFLHSGAGTQNTYFYKLKAEDTAGNLSDFSESTSYTLLPAVHLETMYPNGNSDALKNDRLLNWRYSYTTEFEDYCLTILTQFNELIVRVQLSPADYVNAKESWWIPDSLVFAPNQLYKWRIDLGAQYVNNRETFGAESAWATFLYQNDSP